jgi:hypothetical protein
MVKYTIQQLGMRDHQEYISIRCAEFKWLVSVNFNRQSRHEKNQNKDEIQSSCSNEIDSTTSENSGRQTRSKGVLHNKDLCIWCMKPEDKVHPD